MSERPNVLLIITDQMRRDALGVNGGPHVHTPHLDQLARESVNFTRAYSACPTCIAARATLFTGLRHERHGFTGYDPNPEWKYGVTLPGVFADAGYHTQCVGKMHTKPQRALMGFHNVVLHDGFLHDSRRQHPNPIFMDDYLQLSCLYSQQQRFQSWEICCINGWLSGLIFRLNEKHRPIIVH